MLISLSQAVEPALTPPSATVITLSIWLLMLVGVVLVVPVCAQEEGAGSKAMVIEDSSQGEVIAFGKTVMIRGKVKNALVFGGDVIVEGEVLEDVATVGGSVIQKSSGFIGGDVFALGGAYKAESPDPRRNPDRETVVYAGYEDEIREMVLNPTSLLNPPLSWAFVAQRVLSVIFWFILSVGINTMAPGAVSRAVSRVRLAPLRIFALGVSGFAALTVGLVLALSFLPSHLSTATGLMVLALLLVSYIFGRVALQVAVGKLFQFKVLGESKSSETLAILVGVLGWTLLLSIPYVWTVAVAVLFAASVGLVATAGSGGGWRAARS